MSDIDDLLLREYDEPVEVLRCPECGEVEISQCNHEGDFLAPECDFYICTNCGHQWEEE